MKKQETYVWDKVVRTVHWFLALCILLNLYILEDGEDPHIWVGYTAVALVVIRFIWGILGRNPYALFKNFIPTFSSVKDELAYWIQDKKIPYHKGHSPLASTIMFLMWFLVIALAVSGYMMGTDTYFGEEWVEELHEAFSNILIACIVMHLLGVAYNSYIHRYNAAKSMLTGKKP